MSKDKRYRFKVDVNHHDPNETLNWCDEAFGPKNRKRWGHSKGHWSHNGIHVYTYFYINNEEDAMAFKLRWA